ncbi:MAG: YdcF family protein, partial [Burkholderiaceae bacterium]
MLPGELKPLLGGLLLPPAGPLLLVASGLLLAMARKRLGLALAFVGSASLWLLSCQAIAVVLSATLLPHYPALTAAQARASGAQAIVVLGGGTNITAPEYGAAQPSNASAERLRYGLFLSKMTGLPVAYSGGVGWSGSPDAPAEADAAAAYARLAGQALRWSEAKSRDTQENAQRLREMLQPEGVKTVLLVTHAWHMPRSERYFEAAGFSVVPAPMGFTGPVDRDLLEWLPSAHGLMASRQVL